jgi:hypothetical protein
MKKGTIIAIIVILIAAGIWFGRTNYKNAGVNTTSTPVVENQYSDFIHITYPKNGDKVSSTTPLIVKGEARGSWYFEASFPLVITDWDGKIIGESHAEAQGNWMTTEFVPFQGTIKFTKPSYGTRGTVIFKNDNPSGDPARDKAVEVTVEFI